MRDLKIAPQSSENKGASSLLVDCKLKRELKYDCFIRGYRCINATNRLF